MQNPLLLFPQLNLAASEDKTHYRAMGSAAREEPQETNKPGAKQKRNRLSLLLQRPEVHGGDHLGRPGSLTKAVSVSPEEALKWGESFDKLLSEKAGLDAFTKFLKTEFSEENIEFWIACEDYKKIKSAQELLPKAKTIFETFIEKDAPKEVNLDWHTREVTRVAVGDPGHGAFEAAQRRVYALMEQDSYRRFLGSAAYLGLLRGHSRSCRLKHRQFPPEK
ncbi:regulator of G-protein signaling 18 isoform X2 [Parus major]|uniref:regulator of G-protein signaling 18 isoform X2 n=1 Tax=Parus major TaxID=9157 RepID=UPI0007715AB8|nr:regulator of G-protein signaling 18 isoform X2 [Parus major]